MLQEQWGFVAFNNGELQAGKISEVTLLGEKVLKVELPNGQGTSYFEYHKYSDVKGIRVSSETECTNLFQALLEHNTELRKSLIS